MVCCLCLRSTLALRAALLIAGAGIAVMWADLGVTMSLHGWIAYGLGAVGSIDVDALDFDIQGCMYFSLQSDLLNSAFGVVQDGDVLMFKFNV